MLNDMVFSISSQCIWIFNEWFNSSAMLHMCNDNMKLVFKGNEEFNQWTRGLANVLDAPRNWIKHYEWMRLFSKDYSYNGLCNLIF